MFKLLILFVLNGEPTGEGYLGGIYTSHDACMEAAQTAINTIGPITHGNAAVVDCSKIGEQA